ncbi:MAG: exodeoxyribonuclease VII small subunit, partial [Myxococcota bacterium]
MTDNPTEQVESLGFDQVLERLRGVIRQLETGNLSLDDSLRAYEEGVLLARRGNTLLDSAE